MNHRRTTLLVCCILLIITLLISADNQKSKWKGKIEYENGIKVIKNPEEPLYGEITFELEEVLSIGNEKDENCMFYRPRDLQVDKNGNIYVLDSGNTRIQIFDKKGNYLQTIGKKGQGPGEFERPLRMEIDERAGKIYVSDILRLKTFDKNGNYLEDIIPSTFASDFYLDNESNIFCVFMMSSESRVSNALCKLDSQGKVIKKYAEFPYELSMFKSGESVVTVMTGQEFSLHLSQIDKRTFVYGYSREYELAVTDKDGNTIYKIRKNESYQKFTEKEKQAYKRKGRPIKLPSHKPFFYSILTDSEGRIYATRSHMARRGISVPIMCSCDIYSRDGHYLYKARIPNYPYVINDGHLYTLIESQNTGEVFVKKFKVKNWGQVKKKI